MFTTILSANANLFPSILILLIAIAFLLYQYLQQRARSKAMKDVADAMNLDFYEEDPFRLGQQLRQFDLFTPYFFNWSHDIRNVIPGVLENTQVFLFDYSFRKSKHNTSRQTVFVAINPQWKFRDFRYRHDRWHEAKRIAQQRQGLQGQLKYYHESINTDVTEAQAREQMPPELQALLAEYSPANIESNGGYLVIYVPNMVFNAAFAQTFYENCCALVQLLETKPNMVQKWAEIRTKDYN